MKVLVIVALFAFVAVQVCQSAPVPDDDKVDTADKKDEAPEPVAVAADAPAAAPAAETKSESTGDAAAKPAEDVAAPAAEEKKE